MAVSHDASASAVAAGATTVSVALTIAANRDRYLAIFSGATDGSAPGDVSACTWNTTENAGELADQVSGTNERAWAHGLKNPTAATANASITVATTCDGLFIGACAFYGVDQTTPTGTAAETSALSGNNIWVAVSDGKAGGVVVGSGLRGLSSATANSIADFDGIPEFFASGALSTATAQTSRTPALPSSTLVGDLVIAHCATENIEVHACATAGWNKLGQTDSGASWTVSHWWAIQTGSLADPVITWSSSVDASARTHVLRDTKADGTPCAYHGTVGTGTTSPHTSTGANSTDDDVRVVYVDHCNANTACATPAGWTENTDSGSATGPVRTTFGGIDLATSGTGSGNISVVAGVAAWVQQQIECYQADNGDQIALTERESFGGNFASQAVSYEIVDTYNTLGWIGTSGTTGSITGIAVALHPSKSTPPFSRPPRYMRRAA